MKNRWYILKGREVCKATVTECILFTEIDSTAGVSTVFLGLDHGFYRRTGPIVFETMVFGGKFDEYILRYSTYEEAEVGHWKTVAMHYEESLERMGVTCVWPRYLVGDYTVIGTSRTTYSAYIVKILELCKSMYPEVPEMFAKYYTTESFSIYIKAGDDRIKCYKALGAVGMIYPYEKWEEKQHDNG